VGWIGLLLCPRGEHEQKGEFTTIPQENPLADADFSTPVWGRMPSCGGLSTRPLTTRLAKLIYLFSREPPNHANLLRSQPEIPGSPHAHRQPQGDIP
jgi:hypothetical protein